MAVLTIGEVARRTHLPPSTLRYYEQIGLLPAPQRVRGQRRFDEAVLTHIAMIKFAQHAGFTLAEIRTLLHGFPADTPPSARWRALAQPKFGEIEAMLARLHNMQRALEAGLQCTCIELSECTVCASG